MTEQEMKWLIWSNEHTAWWRANHLGYCYSRAEAGRYTFEEACDVVKNANYALSNSPNEAMVADEPIYPVTTAPTIQV
jgi:hypothetical protein